MSFAFLGLLAASLVLREWLSFRQQRHVLAHRDTVPEPFDIPLEAHHKAADYTVANLRFGRIARFYDAALLLAFTFGGGLRLLAELVGTGPTWRGAVLLLVAFAAYGAAGLPLRLWRTFGLERRFGFNRTTPATFVLDLAREALVGTILGLPLAMGAIALASRGWWLQLWAGWLAASAFFVWIWPAWIAPLFWKFRPLSDADLAARLRALLDRHGFSSGGVFEMDGSRRSRKANAFFAGLGRKKRIVLFDTLLELMEPQQIEAVLAHEIGHDKRRHLLKGLGFSAVLGLLFFAGLAAALSWPPFCISVGVPHSTATGLVLFTWVAPLALLPLRPLLSAWSRRFEYEADAFAVAETGANAMAGALARLYEHNAATLTPDPVHSAFYDSHPPAALRVGRILNSG